MEKIHDLSFILPLAVGAFWAIIFLQSGLDKIFDFKGNKEWLLGHFSKSPIASFTVPMLIVLTVIEILAGIISLIGTVLYIMNGNTVWIIQGLIVSIIALLMLIFGQRIAKDYEGAKTIAIYFGIALVSGIVLL